MKAILLLGLIALPAGAAPLQWRPFAQAPVVLRQQAVRTVSNPQAARFARVQVPRQKTPLYLVDANSLADCGSGGCSLDGYIPSGKEYTKVFEVLLLSRTPPPATPNNFVTVTTQLKHGLPCLRFPIVSQPGDALWCFTGERYTFQEVLGGIQ
ncbi:hypothetical protein [Anthocerotibacter panamensis]|uniref:hypothetical protein n=1 Tax=Anthocerotibacter panamensis TaxID=2857077 RepID=UPI001C40222B|nr:hypothetical protein [Anthocerotibacter panamensis]